MTGKQDRAQIFRNTDNGDLILGIQAGAGTEYYPISNYEISPPEGKLKVVSAEVDIK